MKKIITISLISLLGISLSYGIYTYAKTLISESEREYVFFGNKKIIRPTNPVESVDKTTLKKNSNHNIEADKYAYKAAEIRDYINGKAHTDKKLVFLTFDDGVDTTITPQILDILKEHQVPATFFVLGQWLSNENKHILERQIKEGHSIGLHSFTHNTNLLYPGTVGNTSLIVKETDDSVQVLKNLLGPDFHTNVWRYPGGHLSWRGLENADAILKEKYGLEWIDWNLMNGDAEGPLKKPKTVDSMMTYFYDSGKYFPQSNVKVVLMHDTTGREITVQGLPKIIEHFKNQGYQFAVLE